MHSAPAISRCEACNLPARTNRPMPKRTDIKSILIIGAGPIVIGQACEFDYSGTQACKALKEEGYRVILVNSNPATIMTDPELADATYVEPITPGGRRQDHRQGAARRAAADHGRPDRAEHGTVAAANGRARPLQCRDDRRRRGRHRHGRGPRAVPRGDGAHRAGDAALDAGQRHRRQGSGPQDATRPSARLSRPRRRPTSTRRSMRWKPAGTSARATASSAT